MSPRTIAAVLLSVLALSLCGAESTELSFRVRCTKVTPAVPVRIHFRTGGEGLGGSVSHDELTRFLAAPTGPGALEHATAALQPDDRVIVAEKNAICYYLNPGVWTEPAPQTRLPRGFVSFTIDAQKKEELRDAELAFEFRRGDEVVRSFTVAAPDGATFGIYVPKADTGTPEFLAELGGLQSYIARKSSALDGLLGPTTVRPGRFALLTDCSGYGEGAGYGIRTSDRATFEAELALLRRIGINGLRSPPAFVSKQIAAGEGPGADFSRVAIVHTLGYPIPRVKKADGKLPQISPGDGCPYAPENVAVIQANVDAAVAELLQNARGSGVETVWALTVDEIGSIFDGAPEGKDHQGVCPYCREAFRAMIRADGRSPADFGVDSWEPIRSTYGYWGRSYWSIRSEREAAVSRAQQAMKKAVPQDHAPLGFGLPDDGGVVDALDDIEPANSAAGKKVNTSGRVLATRKALDEILANPHAGQPDTEKPLPFSPSAAALLHYYSRLFNNRASAALFTPLRDAIAAENSKKAAALAAGDTNSAVARQPWLHSYALRGNTFLMKGHSLDFFEFYRAADNGFVYETSNRDPRVWQWDTYLCDVGRTLERFMDHRFGIYVKPHRGAPMQRALTAAARGADLIFWYTYGPEWKKGDTFGGRIDALAAVGRTSKLLAAAEDVVYGAEWAIPAEVALVRPATSEYLGNDADWENGKWVHTALLHAHVPIDALDEGLLLERDLSAYKVIVVSGSHLRRDAAVRLVAWVEAGGTLITCGGGLAFDESGQVLSSLLPVLGLVDRTAPEIWADVPRYGSTALAAPKPSQDAPPAEQRRVTAPGGASDTVVGRECLQPAVGSEVTATFGDGRPASVHNRFGKGNAWTLASYAGLEYGIDPMQGQPYDEGKRAAITAPIRAIVQPVVDPGVPTVDGVLLRHPGSARLAVVLINWTFAPEAREATPQRDLQVRVRAPGSITQARSTAGDTPLAVRRDGDWTVITLPRLDDGDILLLE